jgi:hypothetical protein
VAEIKKLRADGIGVAEIMRRVNLKRATVFKAGLSGSPCHERADQGPVN